ncbi:MAG: hypothetical protein LUK37_03605, partial [Clostridia bacterium]|nr:hypothetical protein [Clostridia bacterium]
MLTSTTTPDGYHVGADGVWLESKPVEKPSQPVKEAPQQSQQQVQPSRTPEEQAQLDELNRLIEEGGKRQTSTDASDNGGHAGAPLEGEINIGG